MPEFRGSKNLHVGADSTVDPKSGKRTDIPAWATSEYDPTTREYVIRLSDEDAAKFRALGSAHIYDFREDTQEPQSDSKVDSEE